MRWMSNEVCHDVNAQDMRIKNADDGCGCMVVMYVMNVVNTVMSVDEIEPDFSLPSLSSIVNEGCLESAP